MQTTRWFKTRKLLNDLHLWFGLISGLIIFIVAFTGTIYVYHIEIRESASPTLYQVEKTAAHPLPVDRLLALAKQDLEGQIVGVRIPESPTAPYRILYHKPEKEGKAQDKKRPNQFLINPYTGAMLGDPQDAKTKTDVLMQRVFSLHRWLLLNEIEKPIFEGIENKKLGSWVTGTATLLFTLGVLSGIVIWFPKRIKDWKKGLKIKWSSKWKRVNHDLHNTFGFYSCIILFLMGITGPFWSFDWYRTGWQKTWGTYQEAPKEDPLRSTIPAAGSSPLAITALLGLANQELTYAGDYVVNLPADSLATVTLAKYKVGFFAPAAADKLMLDQYSGRILSKELFKEKPIRARISASIKSLHIGDVYGSFSKFLYFIASLIATSLPVTGVLIWWNKRRK